MAEISATTIERFNPELDAFSGGALAPKADWRRVELRSILMRAREQAISLLERDFGFAVHLCPVQKAYEEIILGGELEPLLETAGAVFASLDYLFARATPPRLNDDARLQWSFFSSRRCFDFFNANGVRLLAFLGVLRAIPERWLPEGLLDLDLHRRFNKFPFLEKVVFKTSLSSRMSGGIQWLKRKSLEHFAVLERECLMNPVPFLMLLRGLDSVQVGIFIANSCSRGKGNGLMLRYCDAAGTAREMEVALSLADWGSEFVTICGERQQVMALMRVHYVSRVPPLDKWQQLLGAIGIRCFLWRLRRQFRQRLLGKRRNERKAAQQISA